MGRPKERQVVVVTSVTISAEVDQAVRRYCADRRIGLGPVIDRALTEFMAHPAVPKPVVTAMVRRPVRLDAEVHALATAWRADQVVSFSAMVEAALVMFLASRGQSGPSAPYDWSRG